MNPLRNLHIAQRTFCGEGLYSKKVFKIMFYSKYDFYFF